MPNFNQVAIAGTLGQDPEVRYTPGGTAVCDVSVAINRQWFDKASSQKKESVTWVTVTLWGRTAEIAGEYLRKGSPVLIGGRLEESTWNDKDTGAKRSKLKVVCETLQLLGKRNSDDQRPANDNYGEESQVDPKFASDPAVEAGDVPF